MKGKTKLLEMLLDEVRSFRKLVEQHVLEGVDDYGKGCIEEVVDACDNAESVTTDEILWYCVFPEGSEVFGQVIGCGYDVICNDGLARHKLKNCTVRFGDGEEKVFSYEVIRKEIDSYRELLGKEVKFNGVHCYVGHLLDIPDGCVGRIVDYRPKKGEMEVCYSFEKGQWGLVNHFAVYFAWDVRRMIEEQGASSNVVGENGKIAAENDYVKIEKSDEKPKTITFTVTMPDEKNYAITPVIKYPYPGEKNNNGYGQFFVVGDSDEYYEKIRLYRDMLEFAKAANFENKNNQVYGIVKNSTGLFATKNLLSEAVFNVLFCNIEDVSKCIELFGDRIKKHYYGI